MTFSILFEDAYFIVAEKPSGLPSQPTVDKHRPDFYSLLKKQFHSERGQDFYLALHHRLDRDTSGLMIFAKTKEANEPLADLFRQHKIQKTYVCLTAPRACPDQWEIINHLQQIRDSKLKKMKMHSVRSGGDKAHTLFKKLKVLRKGLVIQAQPLTGRMHQIRVHLAEEGLGIFGDDIYPSPTTPQPPRLMLHAQQLDWIHPFTQEAMHVECPLSEDFLAFQQLLT